MTGGQVAALGCAIALLLPGGCFLFLGLAGSDVSGVGIAAPILLLAGPLFWVAFSRQRSPGPPPDAPPHAPER